MLVTADHGNADQMYETKGDKIVMDGDKKKSRTAHSLNQVPFIIYDPQYEQFKDYDLKLNEGLGLSSIAATIFDFM